MTGPFSGTRAVPPAGVDSSACSRQGVDRNHVVKGNGTAPVGEPSSSNGACALGGLGMCSRKAKQGLKQATFG